jgi:hypothetical protein
MRRLPFKRLIPLLASLALLLAMTAYFAHGHRADGKPHDETRCEFCLQVTGTAAASALPSLASRPPFIARLPRARRRRIAVARRPARAHRSRAPPLRRVI